MKCMGNKGVYLVGSALLVLRVDSHHNGRMNI